MGALGNLAPLIILFVVVCGAAYVGYQIYLFANELTDKGVKKMEKKNVSFTKDGMKVGVKEVRSEDYADRTQSAFVKAWNLASPNPADGKRPSNSRTASGTSTRSHKTK